MARPSSEFPDLRLQYLFPRGIENDRDRRDALAFLTATSGLWAKARNNVCDAAGFDPDAIRQRVVAILDGADFEIRGKRDVNISAQNLEAARALWRELNTRPASTAGEVRARRRLSARILLALEGGPLSGQALASRLSVRQSTISDACSRLVAAGKLERVSKYTFALPPKIDQAAAAAYQPEAIESIRARSEQIMAELDAMRAT